jgi:ubiquinone/menaquinone biosynthesis C-methylase UbiE
MISRMTRSTFVRQPLPQVQQRYDRMAPWYRAAEFSILFPRRFRKKAVQRLALEPGKTVLEIGCGTGRNLPLLCDAVGAAGQV